MALHMHLRLYSHPTPNHCLQSNVAPRSANNLEVRRPYFKLSGQSVSDQDNVAGVQYRLPTVWAPASAGQAFTLTHDLSRALEREYGGRGGNNPVADAEMTMLLLSNLTVAVPDATWRDLQSRVTRGSNALHQYFTMDESTSFCIMNRCAVYFLAASASIVAACAHAREPHAAGKSAMHCAELTHLADERARGADARQACM